MSALALASTTSAEARQPKSVALGYIVDHPAIDAAKQGIIEALAANGFKVGSSLKLQVQGAQGSMATQMQIARKFVGDAPDVIIAISTQMAQAIGATLTLGARA